MAHNFHADMSELEREYELELIGNSNDFSDEELELEFEYIMDDEEELEFEFEFEQDSGDEENELEYEYEYEDSLGSGTFGERLYELSQKEFESEYEMDEALNEIFDDMEREFFFKKLWKAGKNLISKNPLIKNLAGKALNLAAGFIPGGRVGLSALKTFGKPLLKGIRQNWSNVAKAGISAVAPNAMKSVKGFASKLGIAPENAEESNQEAFEKIAEGIQRSYEFAADHFGDRAGDPIIAGRLANRAFEAGVMPVIQGRASAKNTPGKKQTNSKGRRVIHLREQPGEEIEKIIILIDKKA